VAQGSHPAIFFLWSALDHDFEVFARDHQALGLARHLALVDELAQIGGERLLLGCT
jgi:hypothetical protein